MSSACVCHIPGEWCFYCEMYVPLERKYEKLLAEVERQREQDKKHPLTRAFENLERYRAEGVIERYAPSNTRPPRTGSTDDATEQV